MSIPRVPKHPDESFSISLDFTDRLMPGETVASATVARLSGTANVGSPSVSSPLVSFTVGGGTAEGITPIEVKATTSAAALLVGLVDVPVSDRNF